MKKNKLDLPYLFNFELAGIVSNIKEYKLAWHLNDRLGLNLAKQPDIKIEFSNRSSVLISNFRHETDFIRLNLLQNKLVAGNSQQYLMPEVRQFDYFLKLSDDTEETKIENICEIIKEIPLVEYVSKLNFGDLKSKENLLY